MRQRDTLRYDQTLFRDREVFEFTYMPDELHHRDAQIRELFAEIEETTQQIAPVYINCQQHRTPFAVFACIFEAVVGYTPPATGKHLDEVVGLAATSKKNFEELGI